jgi:hypothetical protein
VLVGLVVEEVGGIVLLQVEWKGRVRVLLRMCPEARSGSRTLSLEMRSERQWPEAMGINLWLILGWRGSVTRYLLGTIQD